MKKQKKVDRSKSLTLYPTDEFNTNWCLHLNENCLSGKKKEEEVYKITNVYVC